MYLKKYSILFATAAITLSSLFYIILHFADIRGYPPYPLGIIFGIILTLILTFIVRKSDNIYRRLGYDNHGFSIRVNKVVTQDIEKDQAISLYKKTLETIHTIKSIDVSPGSGKIEAKTKISWQSWGEKITIEVTGTSAQATDISITCQPRFSFTIADMGQSAIMLEVITGVAEKLKNN